MNPNPKNKQRNDEKKKKRGDREPEKQRVYYPPDKVRRMNEACGAPERVIEVGAVTLELGGKAAVNNRVAAGLAEEIVHESG